MLSLLLVDDDPDLLESLYMRLHGDFECIVRADGPADAVRAATERRFDVVVSDYSMPDQTGLELLSRFKEMQPSCARVLLSGMLDLPILMEAVNRGEIHRVLQKPIRVEDLRRAVIEASEWTDRLETIRAGLELEQSVQGRERLAKVLRDSIQLAIQPIVTGDGNSVFAYEALLRSTDPVLSGPMEVLGEAERHSAIVDVASVVMRRAASWLDEIPEDVSLFVNMHPAEFADPVALLRRLEALEPYARRVVLEITERSRIEDFASWRESMAAVRERGFRLAVDDLGAGYSSLSVLAEILPDVMKLDMSLVRDVDSDLHRLRLVELLVRFADTIGAMVVGEGVETRNEWDALKTCGVHLIQGHYFSPARFSTFDVLAPRSCK